MTARRSLRAALLALLALVCTGATAHAADPRTVIDAQSAEFREIDGTTILILRGLGDEVVTRSDIPDAERTAESPSDLARRWARDGLDQTPPTADLYLTPTRSDDVRVAVVVLLRPRVSGDTMTFTVRNVRDQPTSGVGNVDPGEERLAPATYEDVRVSIATGIVNPPRVSVAERVQRFLNDWSAPGGLVFMILIAIFIWRQLKAMPRTAPKQIKPDAKSAVSWEEIAGADDAKEELMEVVQFLRDPKRFRRYGAVMPKGVLLHGPPGTGKTLLAKAVAHESGAQFFSQSASSFVEMFAGLGAARIRRLFAEARDHAPAIIFIDELDAVGGTRTGSDRGDREQTLNQLLVEMDGFTETEDIVVMAASNFLEALDKALLRPGRFDRQVFVSPPDIAGRQEILRVHTRAKPLHDVDLRAVAAQTSGLTGADLANLCNEAAIFAARRKGAAITQKDFDLALERVVAGVQSKRVLQPAERRVVAYHEAGHALCAELLPSVDRVHKISIVPRGKALGFTLNLPEEDRYLKTREELLDHMAMLLGGRVAEEIVFGRITTGASDDLRRVAELTHAMVHEYAMGTADSAQRGTYEHGQVSEVTRRIRDEEQRELAFEAQAMAERLITAHRDKLDELAAELLAHEVLERTQIDAIMGDTPRADDRPRMTGVPTVTAVNYESVSGETPVRRTGEGTPGHSS